MVPTLDSLGCWGLYGFLGESGTRSFGDEGARVLAGEVSARVSLIKRLNAPCSISAALNPLSLSQP